MSISEIRESRFLRVIPYFSINCIFLSIGVNLQAPLLTAKAASTKKNAHSVKEQAFHCNYRLARNTTTLINVHK